MFGLRYGYGVAMPELTRRPSIGVPDGFNWQELDQSDVPRLAVALVREALIGHGLRVRQPADHISTLLARRGDREIEVQVRSARKRSGAPFWRKQDFEPHEDLYAAVVILDTGRPPALYLVSSLAWRSPDDVLRDLPNRGGKTVPEWRFNITRKYDGLLAQHAFSKVVTTL